MKKLLVLIICATGIVFLEADPVQPATLEVRPPGGVGTLDVVYTSIQQAIDAADPFDIIEVAAGTYDMNTVGPDWHLVIDKANLTLKSLEGVANTIINVRNGVGIDIRAGADNFVLGGADSNGFTIRGSGDTTFNIQLSNAPSGVEISHNTIDTTGNASMGVSVGAAGAADLTISNNDFVADSGDGCIWGPRLVDLTVSDNTFDGGAYAIQTSGVTSSSPSVISGNVITSFDGSGGIVICNGEATSDLSITGNTITGCTSAIRFAEYCAQGSPGDMTTVTIEDNTLSTNDKGIRIGDGDHVIADAFVITHNKISGNMTYGVQNEHATRVVTAEYNWWGDVTGPHDGSDDTGTGGYYNPDGLGDEVSDYVDYEPWYCDEAMLDRVTVKIGATEIVRAYSNTIQAGIDAAHEGDTIVAEAGIYDEQVFIDESLTLIGAGAATTTIIAPASMDTALVRGSSQAIQGVVNVIGATAHGITVDVNGFTVDGNYVEPASSSTWFAGIVYSDANGIIQNNIITKVRQATLGEGSASWRGHGVWLGDASTVTVKENTISQWQRNGVEIRDAAATATITDNTFTGYETAYTVVNAVTFYGATDGTVSRNTITDCRYTGAGSGNDFYGGTQACGIMSYEGSGTFTVSDNTIQDCDIGIYSRLTSAGIIADNTLEDNLYFGIVFRKGDVTATGNTITGSEVGILIPSSRPASSSAPAANCNKISGNSVYGVRNDAAYSTDANSNWWGSATGPSGEGGGSGDAVSTNVDFFPWLLTDNIEACAELTQVAADFVVDDDWEGLPDYNTVTVDSTDYYIGLNAFAVIQDAVDAVVGDGNSIYVQDGNYAPFTVDGKTNLTIIASSNPVVQGVQSVTTAYGDRDCVVFVKDSVNVVLNQLDIQGVGLGTINTKNYGVICENSSGGIEDCTVDPNTISDMSSTAIGIWDGSVLIVKGCLLERFGRLGILVYNGTTAEILENEIIGQVYADGNEVNYGIEVEGAFATDDPDTASSATIKRNEIYNCDNTFTPEPKWASSAIYVNGWMFYGPEADSTITVVDNDIYDNYNAIYVVNSPSSRATLNNIYDNRTTGVESVAALDSNTAVFDAEYNWWGDASGPNDPCGTTETDGTACPDVSVIKNADGLGDGVSENVSYCAWLIVPACTSTAPCPAGDLNGDGCVNWFDLAILADEWLEGCG